jgi:Calcineurin-like phosphoesterase
MKRTLFVGALCVLVCGCGGPERSSTPTEPSPPVAPVASSDGPILVGAGDIADCSTIGSQLTSRVLDGIPGTVFTTGDNAYPVASEANYRECYDPTWGRHKNRTRPVPGNHEYETARAAPYFDYFGANAGPRGLGYYSYTVGTWHVVALNSEIEVGTGSAQVAWLRAELAGSSARCTAAIWHRPLFSSGAHGDNPDLRDVWRVLYEHNVDVVINGHDHMYERFAPMDADGRSDPRRGIREFVVGTGGAPLHAPDRVRANSELQGADLGVVVLRLSDGGYSWSFQGVGSAFSDFGTGTCH